MAPAAITIHHTTIKGSEPLVHNAKVTIRLAEVPPGARAESIVARTAVQAIAAALGGREHVNKAVIFDPRIQMVEADPKRFVLTVKVGKDYVPVVETFFTAEGTEWTSPEGAIVTLEWPKRKIPRCLLLRDMPYVNGPLLAASLEGEWKVKVLYLDHALWYGTPARSTRTMMLVVLAKPGWTPPDLIMDTIEDGRGVMTIRIDRKDDLLLGPELAPAPPGAKGIHPESEVAVAMADSTANAYTNHAALEGNGGGGQGEDDASDEESTPRSPREEDSDADSEGGSKTPPVQSDTANDGSEEEEEEEEEDEAAAAASAALADTTSSLSSTSDSDDTESDSVATSEEVSDTAAAVKVTAAAAKLTLPVGMRRSGSSPKKGGKQTASSPVKTFAVSGRVTTRARSARADDDASKNGKADKADGGGSSAPVGAQGVNAAQN